MNPTKLSNIQLELLELFAEGVSDEEALEIKQLLGMYYAQKAIAAADKVWEEKKLSQKVMDEWSKKKMRTPYLAQQKFLKKQKQLTK